MKKLVVIAMAALFTAGAYAADVAIPTSVKSMLQPRVKGQRSCQKAAPTMVVSERKGNGRTVRLARVVMHDLFTPSRIEVSGFSLSLCSFCPTSQPAPQCFPLLMSWPPGYFVSRIFHTKNALQTERPAGRVLCSITLNVTADDSLCQGYGTLNPRPSA